MNTKTSVSLILGIVAAATLSACGGSTQSGCTPSPLAKYPLTLVKPVSGSTNVSPNIGSIIVETSGSPQLLGTVTLVGPSGKVVLNPAPASGGASGAEFSAPIPTLASATTYSVIYSVTYPGSCQMPPVTETQTVGTFTTAQ